jgi:hypothetical protein
MRARQTFCTVTVRIPVAEFDVLAAAARQRGVSWHVAYAEVETQFRAQAAEIVVQIIDAYARGADAATTTDAM